MDFLLWSLFVLCIFALVFIAFGEIAKRERLVTVPPRPTMEFVQAVGTLEEGLWSKLHYIMRKNGSSHYVLVTTTKARNGGYFVHLFLTDANYYVPENRAPFDTIYIDSHLDVRFGLSQKYRLV